MTHGTTLACIAFAALACGGSNGTDLGESGGTPATGGASGATSSGGSSTAGGHSSIGGGGTNSTAGAPATSMSFFVTSDTSGTADLGGLDGADARCRALAQAVGAGSRTWHAYLSAEHDPNDAAAPVNARDRIGTGPWVNSVGVELARDLDALHALDGNAELFVDEHGNRINGQWAGSPAPVEHDILTGSNPDGTVMPGMTCADWTSATTTSAAQVGHSDGLGPGMSSDPPYNSWNSAHANQSCADTAPRGGAGRLYCFAVD